MDAEEKKMYHLKQQQENRNARMALGEGHLYHAACEWWEDYEDEAIAAEMKKRWEGQCYEVKLVSGEIFRFCEAACLGGGWIALETFDPALDEGPIASIDVRPEHILWVRKVDQKLR